LKTKLHTAARSRREFPGRYTIYRTLKVLLRTNGVCFVHLCPATPTDSVLTQSPGCCASLASCSRSRIFQIGNCHRESSSWRSKYCLASAGIMCNFVCASGLTSTPQNSSVSQQPQSPCFRSSLSLSPMFFSFPSATRDTACGGLPLHFLVRLLQALAKISRKICSAGTALVHAMHNSVMFLFGFTVLTALHSS
jgi:hypothetical protein